MISCHAAQVMPEEQSPRGMLYSPRHFHQILHDFFDRCIRYRHIDCSYGHHQVFFPKFVEKQGVKETMTISSLRWDMPDTRKREAYIVEVQYCRHIEQARTSRQGDVSTKHEHRRDSLIDASTHRTPPYLRGGIVNHMSLASQRCNHTTAHTKFIVLLRTEILRPQLCQHGRSGLECVHQQITI